MLWPHFPVVGTSWYSHHIKFGQWAPQNWRYWTDCAVTVLWAEFRKPWNCDTSWMNRKYCYLMNNDLLEKTSWDFKKELVYPNFHELLSTQLFHRFVQKLCFHHINKSESAALQLRYMESDRNIIIAAPTAFDDIQTTVDRAIVGMANY